MTSENSPNGDNGSDTDTHQKDPIQNRTNHNNNNNNHNLESRPNQQIKQNSPTLTKSNIIPALDSPAINGSIDVQIPRTQEQKTKPDQRVKFEQDVNLSAFPPTVPNHRRTGSDTPSGHKRNISEPQSGHKRVGSDTEPGHQRTGSDTPKETVAPTQKSQPTYKQQSALVSPKQAEIPDMSQHTGHVRHKSLSQTITPYNNNHVIHPHVHHNGHYQHHPHQHVSNSNHVSPQGSRNSLHRLNSYPSNTSVHSAHSLRNHAHHPQNHAHHPHNPAQLPPHPKSHPTPPPGRHQNRLRSYSEASGRSLTDNTSSQHSDHDSYKRFTPPPSPGQQRPKSAHSSPSSQTKNHHVHSSPYRNGGKKSHSSKSDSSDEEKEKCLPQMESIVRQMASGKVTTDSLVNNFGGCGPFQVLLVMATYSAQIAAVWGMMFMAFGNYHPKWWCYDDEGALASANSTLMGIAAKSTVSAPLAGGLNISTDTLGAGGRKGAVGSGSSAYISPVTGGVWSIRATDPRANQTGSCNAIKKCKRIEFDPDTSTAATEWSLICDEAWSQSAIISLQMTGVLVGACLGGFIGDRRGRKITLYVHLFFLAVFNILAIFSPTWQVFTFFRFLIGACVGGVLAVCILYPVEFVDVWWRGILCALPVWNVGAATFSVATWLIRDWKQLHIATAVVSLLIFLPVFWVPESMRWLAVNGRVDDAKCIANKIASMNRRPQPNTTVLEIIAKEEKRMSRIKGTYSKYTVLDLFADRFIRRISIRMGFIWLCMSACYYALSFGIKNFSGDFYINFIAFSAAEVPGMLFVAPATNKLGRRLGCVVYFISTAVCCAAVVVVSFAASGGVRGTIITVLAMLAKMHILAVWMMLTVFCTELYPTVIRNLSIGYLNACARVGGIAAPFLLPNSNNVLFISFTVMGLMMVACCYLLKTLPETKGRPLEDTIKARSHLSIIVEETEFEVRVSESAQN